MLVEKNTQDKDLLDNCYNFLCGSEATLWNVSRATNEKAQEDNDYKFMNYVKIWLYSIVHVFLFSDLNGFLTQILCIFYLFKYALIRVCFNQYEYSSISCNYFLSILCYMIVLVVIIKFYANVHRV